ncbi:ABC transporter ATP-binding protein [Thalassotalea marina]|uniref:Macrolide export ATP-binding/permease protein MacB n=1 Tax=Thalassotalea marina TaxID=1673741 RepID=A0A919EIQ3_9GAMM|nr:ABC transporter ATP-binding protein [Thalassotalea marina]GHF84893.1 macrolide export ATP-binding/permease protein MacB [Thalassotalea marina]
MNTLIALQQVDKSFQQAANDSPVLQDIELTIHDGESIAIVGPSGSGKSTLLSIIGLLDEPSSGTYLLRTQDVTQLTRQQKSSVRNEHIGWIFQNFNLIASMTVLENVVQPMRFNPSVASSDYVARAEQALAQVGLSDKKNSTPDQLSGGQQQRVAIARALVNKPSLILADEPTGNLDQKTGEEIMALLHSLCQQGSTLVVVTHDEKVAASCQRRIEILDGRIVNDH